MRTADRWWPRTALGRSTALLLGGLVLLGLAGYQLWAEHAAQTPADPVRASLPAPAQEDPYIEETYREALAYYEELQFIPCYCGCHRLGHTSNADCYLWGPPDDGPPSWVNHAAT